MRSVGAFEAKTHLSSLLEAAERGERITITKRGRPVAMLVPADSADRQPRAAAARRIRALRKQIRWRGTVEEILSLRDEGRR